MWCMSSPMLKSPDVEIERKFIVNPQLLPPLPPGQRLTQGYLSESPCVRVRVSENKAWITIKGDGLLSREEYEFEHSTPSDVDRISRMLSNLGRAHLSKTRYQLLGPDGLKWDVDQFYQAQPGGSLAGLWVAEVELDSPTQSVQIPAWAVQEVTYDDRFSNLSLSRVGMPTGYDFLK